jgi:hypothetical protein
LVGSACDSNFYRSAWSGMDPVDLIRDSVRLCPWIAARAALFCRGPSHGVPKHAKPSQVCPCERGFAMAAGGLDLIRPTAFIYPMIRDRDRVFDIPVMPRDPSSLVTRLCGCLPACLSLAHAVDNQILPIAGGLMVVFLPVSIWVTPAIPWTRLFHGGNAREQAVRTGRFSVRG